MTVIDWGKCVLTILWRCLSFEGHQQKRAVPVKFTIYIVILVFLFSPGLSILESAECTINNGNIILAGAPHRPLGT